MSNDQLTEVLDRVKRIETRTTIIGRHLGADVGGGKPRWVGPTPHSAGRIIIPTRNCSIGEMMKVIPLNWDKGVHVYHEHEYLFSLTIIPQ